MRKLKLFFACLLMTVLSIGQMWATDEVVYTLTPVAGSENGYATNEDIDITDGETTITWNVTGNATLTPWRIGGKNLSGVNREVYSKDAMSAAITKVELTVGTASSVTVNSLKLIVASDEDFSDVIDEVTEDFTASSTITFEPTSPATKWATGAYYKFVFNVTIGGNNKYVQFTEAKFYAEAAAPAYTITAQSNDESKGTVSLTGSVITGSPKANCRYASPAYTVTSGNATVAQSGNAFTVTPSSDCTVRINFEAIPQYTVTWNNNGSTSTSQVLEGNKPVFPATPAACDATSTSFIGWATAPWDGKLANLSGKTVYTSADAMPAVNAAVTYYAVFAKSSGTASNLFEWAGGSSADLTAEGNHVTAQGLGSDYAAGNSPYLVKFDGTGDYIIIDTEAAIGSVDIRVKMIGGANTSSITVQEADSKDAELFTDVETLSISGAQNDVVNLATTNAFASTSRAVKLLFTKGSNVGLGPITIVGAVSMSDYMTTCAAPTCEDLGTPSVTVTNKTYNSAKLTWEAVANAAKYVVKFNGEDHEVTNNYYDATGLTPSTQYTYQVKAIAAANQDDYCDGEFTTEANFTTENAPEVQLWLVEKQGETAKNGGTHALGVEFDIPASTLECSKVFRGWTTETYKDYTHATDAPAVLMNKYTFESETAVTLYAVYADVAAGPTTNIRYTGSTTGNMSGENDAADLVDATDKTGWSVVGYKGGGSNFPGLNKDGTIRLYYNAGGNSSIEVTAPQAIASVGLTLKSGNDNVIVKVGGNTVAISDGVYPIGATSFTIINGNTTNVQAHIQNIAVNFPGAQSNWATTCADPLDNPTFSLDPDVAPVAGEYNEAINVVITNNAGEGTIYYTTNGQNPTSASTEYTEPIELNTCGTKTIKAIVISATNQSEVVSATYVLNLAIPSVSAEDPYTEAEAVQVYNSGCYDDEDVWVTGTVQTAQFYSSKTYTITLTNGFQFYYFYESFDGENLVPFENDYIVEGDVLVAKGKLGKHNTTHQIADGYLVSRTPASKEPIDSDIDNPLSVAAALNYIDNAATYDLSEDEYVTGIVESIAECPQHEGTYDIIVLDATDNTKQMKFFGCDVKTFAGIKQYDQITGKGKLNKYYSTYELNYPCEVAALTPYVAPAVSVTGVTVEETATVMVGKTVQLTATVAPEGATNKNVTWSVKEGDEAYAEVSATGLVTGLAEGEATIIVTTEDGGFTDECVVTVNPIPYWATVYDNNVAVVHGGTSGVDNGTITISETAYKLVKAGASSKTGTIIVTVPAGATDIHFHAFAWGGTTSKIQIAGVDNPSISVFDLAGEAGASGNGNDFTLQGDPVDQYFHVSFDAVGAVTEITFSKATGSADNRFFFYGVNQEGGDFGSYQRPTTSGNYGTICLPYAGTISGATLLDIAYFDGAMIYCDEVNGVALKAGKPYIFYATSNSLNVAYTANIETAAGEANGLHGFYNLSNMATDAADKKDLDQNDGNYILYQNQYWLVSGRDAYINNFRAYIKLDEISTEAPDPTPGAAPRRRVAMTVNGEQTATGIGELNASETPVKMIIDGQLFIIRGEKMYNVNGQVVK